MKKLILAAGIAVLTALATQAQNTSLEFAPGKLVVLRGGNGAAPFTFAAKARRFPIYLDEFDPVASNSTPILSVSVPTNGPDSMWINLHAGSEGQGISRSSDRQFIAITGYHGVLTNVTTTPSSAIDCTRGFETWDSFTNIAYEYDSQDWFGIPPGTTVTQNNPRGVATDGTNNFWGCGTVAGFTNNGSFVETGTFFQSPNVNGGVPQQVQNQCSSGYDLRIIGGTLYMVVENETGGGLINGVYNFLDFNNSVVPLPWAPGQEQQTTFTNGFLNFGTVNGKAVSSALTFDMNPAGTIAYAADQSIGIVKYVNTDGIWVEQYNFGTTNLGTTTQTVKGSTGCWGICVDFSGTNPVIYATTTEAGDGSDPGTSNRLVTIVDAGNPGTNLVAKTLAIASGPNDGFRGVDFAPDLRPIITTQPVNQTIITNHPGSFTMTATSFYPVGYQWQENGVNVTNSSNIGGATGSNPSGSGSSTLSFANADFTNDGNYTVIITNQYGAVTSQVATLTVALPTAAFYTNAVLNLTNFIGDDVNIAATSIGGTPPFTYKWFNGATALSDGQNGSGSGYFGSQSSPTLLITNAQISDSGLYYIGVTNSAGGTNVEIANLSVQIRIPQIGSGGQPASIALLVGQTGTLTVGSVVGTPTLNYQWYQGNTGPVTFLGNSGDFNNTGTATLSVGPAAIADGTNYFCIISNAGGSTTSEVATVTVVIAPPASYLGYSNQLYTQNFDSLPNPGQTTVNTVGGGGPVNIGSTTYDVANPFDFAAPVFPGVNGAVDGLGLSNTMSGWYGECDLDGNGGQLGAQEGDQTTGGIISFGPTNTVPATMNRALGLIATSTSGGSHFGLKLINNTGSSLNYFNMGFVGQYWKGGGTSNFKVMNFSYLVDSANSTFSSAEIASSIANNSDTNLSFSFPALGVVPLDPTQATNHVNIATNNYALATPWTPGAALWLVWSINNAGGSGQGYAIDNFSFYASTVPTYAFGNLGGFTYANGGVNAGVKFNFTATAGASASFTIWGTTNLLAPASQWKNLGHPLESPAGVYNFSDQSATSKAAQFYRVTSP